MINPARAIVGIATCFDTRSANGDRWSLDQWQQWLDLETALPVLYDHGPLVNSRGVIATIGTARRFCPITYPTAGLLALCEIDHAEGYGDSVLAEVSASLDIWSDRTPWGYSIGAHTIPGEAVLPFELSVTSRPAYADARILGVGQGALEVWSLLTEYTAVASS